MWEGWLLEARASIVLASQAISPKPKSFIYGSVYVRQLDEDLELAAGWCFLASLVKRSSGSGLLSFVGARVFRFS